MHVNTCLGKNLALTNDKQFQMRVSSEFLAGIDDWRRSQAGIPARAEAIRTLSERAVALSKLQARNASLRERIERVCERATESTREKVDGVAKGQSLPSSDDALEVLTDIFENLRQRALILISEGVAGSGEFPDLER
jgi:hypothetical protein